MKTKVCSECNKELSIDKFSEYKEGYRRNQCIDCFRKRNAAAKRDKYKSNTISDNDTTLEDRVSKIENKLGYLLENDNINLGFNIELIMDKGDRVNKTLKISKELLSKLELLSKQYRLSISDIVNVFLEKGIDNIK